MRLVSWAIPNLNGLAPARTAIICGMSSEKRFSANVAADYPDCLRDESRRVGQAASISFPETEDEIRETLARMRAAGTPVTVQGARTGITAGAVPEGGHVLNLSRMSRVAALGRDPQSGAFRVTVEPGLLLTNLREALARKDFAAAGWSEDSLRALREFKAAAAFFLPPDPTETTASLGGMAACNASGACSFGYGPTRAYVEAVRLILTDGSALSLRRGRDRAQGRAFALASDTGRRIAGELPRYLMPRVKNAAGYFAADDMDLVDLVVGSEGTLGVVTQIELRLVPAPAAKWGITAFFPSEAGALRFVRAARSPDAGLRPCAVEFFDCHAIAMLMDQRRHRGAFAELPEAPPGERTAIYVEYHGESEDRVADAVSAMSPLLVACGGAEDETWIATTEREMEPLRKFRHAVPEAVNLLIDERRRHEPALTKLGTDMAVPDDGLEAVIALYRQGLARTGLEHVIFGHIGNNHVHVNILPRRMG